MKIITRLSFICFTIIVCTLVQLPSVYAQNYLHESFDSTTFPPAGWSDVYVNGSSVAGGDTVWYRQTDTGVTFPPGIYPHSGKGMASYNSWNMEVNSNALLVTPAINFRSYATGSNILSFWFYKSNDITGGFSGSESDDISVWLDTSAYLTTPKLLGTFMNGIYQPPVVAAEGWYQYTLLIPDSLATSSHVYIIFEATSNYDDDLFLDDVSIDHVPPCGTPAVTLNPLSQNINLCIGDTFLLAKSNSFMPVDQKYQWQYAFSAIGPWSDIAGATNAAYKGATVSGTEYFRLKDSCIVSGRNAYSSIDTINAGPPSYASLPYVQDFEHWQNYCNVLDVPDGNWVNTPNVGHSSWRRNDQGCSLGNWISDCSFTINSWGGNASDSGLHCARFHSAGVLPDTAAVWRGSLDMYVNCNAVGKKTLKFSYINQKVPYSLYPEYNNDSIKVLLSIDGGVTFAEIWSADTARYWKKVNLEITSASATTVIRFLAKRNGGDPVHYGYTYDLSDIGIDNVQLIPACSSKPAAGILTPDTICAGTRFTRQLVGSSLAEDLAYQWQKSTDSLTWVNIPGDTSDIDTFSFTVNTYLRVIVKCRNTGLTDTSNTIQVIMRPFYKCYCNPIENVTSNYLLEGIGSFSIISLPGSDTMLNHITNTSVINNPWAMALTPTGSKAGLSGYTNFTDTFPATALYLDSSYQFSLEAVLPGSYVLFNYPIVVYIDYDHSGTFDSSENELVFNKAASRYLTIPTDTVHIPLTAKKGLTGMRILTGPYNYGALPPCGKSGPIYGEIRDYFVNIDYAPCKGSIDAGLSLSSPESPCFGERYLLLDTSHDYKHTGISWNWLTSGDSISWENIPLTVNRDTLTQIFDTSAWYRLQMVCLSTHDTTYSNSIFVAPDNPYRCYCYNVATGGSTYDSSDINSFSFGPYIINKTGTRLLNGTATEDHERYDDSVLDLYIGTTYHVALSPTYRTATAGDAKITLFIDYNNNLRYDAPQERLWTAYTSPALWDIAADITIPDSVVLNVPTGMRVILNNNIKGTRASDNGCGTYTSGETMDFVVRFKSGLTTGIGSIGNMANLAMYPDPTDGRFKVSFSSQSVIKDLQISVTNMTGQQVFARSYTNTQGQFNTEIDLSAAARGVYFVTFMADGERMIRKMVLK